MTRARTKFRHITLVAGTMLLAGALAALAANTTLFSPSLGDIVFPFSPPTNNGATPGTIDNMVVGGTTPAAVTATTVSATTYAGVGIATKLAAPGPIGSTTPSTGAFTTLSASSTVSGAGFNALLASPPAIGGTAPAAGSFTTINGNTFTAGTGTLTIAAAKTLTASNSLTLAGTDGTTQTFPSTSATIARTDAGQTFTGVNNFTAPGLTNPVIVGPAPVVCGASCAPTAGQLITIAVNTGGSATLPTSSGSGNTIRIRVTITQGSGTIKVLLTTTSDVIIGTAIGENAATAKVFVGNAAANHSIQMPFAGTQPSGGFNGDLITCTDMATGTWACDVLYQAGTTPTTPYSTSTT